MAKTQKEENIQTQVVEIKNVLTNTGQIEGLPENPRIIKDDKFVKLVKSIQEFPEMLQARPIVVDESMVVLGGNMRLKACIEAGLTSVPVMVVKGWTTEKKAEFIIKDNVGFGEWDWDILANTYDNTLLIDWGINDYNLGLGDWENLDYIESADGVDLDKELTLRITIENEYKDTEPEIRNAINTLLEKFNGTKLQ